MSYTRYPKIFWDNLFYSGTITAEYYDTGYPPDNVSDWRTYERWHSTGNSSVWIKCACASAKSVSAIAIAGHNLDGATMLLEGSPDNTNWTTITTQTVSGNKCQLWTIDPAVSYQYYRVTFSGGSVGTALQLGVLYIGTYLEIPQLPIMPFDPDQLEDTSSKQYGYTGHILGFIEYFTSRVQKWKFNFLSRTWITTYWLPFLAQWRNKPFIWAWDIINHPLEVYLMYLDTENYSAPYESIWRSLELPLRGKYEPDDLELD
jgi:F5/8 type C domain